MAQKRRASTFGDENDGHQSVKKPRALKEESKSDVSQMPQLDHSSQLKHSLGRVARGSGIGTAANSGVGGSDRGPRRLLHRHRHRPAEAIPPPLRTSPRLRKRAKKRALSPDHGSAKEDTAGQQTDSPMEDTESPTKKKRTKRKTRRTTDTSAASSSSSRRSVQTNSNGFQSPSQPRRTLRSARFDCDNQLSAPPGELNFPPRGGGGATAAHLPPIGNGDASSAVVSPSSSSSSLRRSRRRRRSPSPTPPFADSRSSSSRKRVRMSMSDDSDPVRLDDSAFTPPSSISTSHSTPKPSRNVSDRKYDEDNDGTSSPLLIDLSDAEAVAAAKKRSLAASSTSTPSRALSRSSVSSPSTNATNDLIEAMANIRLSDRDDDQLPISTPSTHLPKTKNWRRLIHEEAKSKREHLRAAYQKRSASTSSSPSPFATSSSSSSLVPASSYLPTNSSSPSLSPSDGSFDLPNQPPSSTMFTRSPPAKQMSFSRPSSAFSSPPPLSRGSSGLPRDTPGSEPRLPRARPNNRGPLPFIQNSDDEEEEDGDDDGFACGTENMYPK